MSSFTWLDGATSALAVTLIGWSITKTARFFRRQDRIKKALLVDIEIQFDGLRTMSHATEDLFKKYVKADKKIPYSFLYQPGEYLLYQALLQDLTIYLCRDQLTKVIKLYQKLWESEAVIDGFATTMRAWEQNKRELSQDDVVHLEKKKDRIASYCKVIAAKDIKRLSDLPNDYEDVEGPDATAASCATPEE